MTKTIEDRLKDFENILEEEDRLSKEQNHRIEESNQRLHKIARNGSLSLGALSLVGYGTALYAHMTNNHDLTTVEVRYNIVWGTLSLLAGVACWGYYKAISKEYK